MDKKKSNLTGTSVYECTQTKVGKSFGSHFIIELIDCAPDKLRKVDYVQKTMIEVTKECKSIMVGSGFYQFEPEGVSGMILIKESHFSIHTWPEESYAAADVFTCGLEMNPYIAIELMKERFGAREVRYQEIQRGF